MGDESITVSKWVVSILLVLAFISSVYALFNLVNSSYNKRVDNMRQTASSYSAQRMYELAQKSQNGEPTTVANAATILRDFGSDTLLFIRVLDEVSTFGTTDSTFIYSNLQTEAKTTTAVGSGDIQVSEQPIEMAVRTMLHRADCKCYVQVIGYKYNSTTHKYSLAAAGGTDNVDKHTELSMEQRMQNVGTIGGASHDAIALVFYIVSPEE